MQIIQTSVCAKVDAHGKEEKTKRRVSRETSRGNRKKKERRRLGDNQKIMRQSQSVRQQAMIFAQRS